MCYSKLIKTLYNILIQIIKLKKSQVNFNQCLVLKFIKKQYIYIHKKNSKNIHIV